MLQRSASVNSGLYLAVRLRDIELMSALGQLQPVTIISADCRLLGGMVQPRFNGPLVVVFRHVLRMLPDI